MTPTDAEARAAFARYVDDRRGHDIPGYRADRADDVVRFTPREPGEDGFAAYTRLTPGAEGREIDAVIAHFDALGLAFEWKVYAYDEPADLMARLCDRGFVAGDEETFMLCRLDRVEAAAPRRTDWTIDRVASAARIDAIVALQEAIYREPFDWLGARLERTLTDAPHTLSIFGAYAGGTLIGAGWIEYPPSSAFPELHGGGVLAAWRGRGVYADLFAVRATEARKRGHGELAVDASPASGPILERIGFCPICTTWPMRRPAAQTAPR